MSVTARAPGGRPGRNRLLPIRRPLLALALLALALALAGGAFLAGRRLLRRMEIEPFRSDVALSAPFSGTLRVSAFAGGAGDARGGARSVLSQRHVFTFVDGPTYSGMEDNDLRGFLDGTYKHAWNQARQVHVRVGRRDGSEAYGEYELFRVVQRWEGIELPPGAIVTRGTLTIGVESGPADSVRLVLYEMKRDYRTGGGGTLGDNVSPPRPGEVWWNDAAFGEEAWALPGAGYASDTDRQADTGAMPLADAVYVPGASRVIFDSAGLASCATRRIAAGRPLLFLLKVGDVEEDTPGSVVTLYSANEGDSRNVARRPRLELEWEAPGEVARIEQAVRLEPGRVLALPELDLAAGAARIACTWLPDPGSPRATVEIRTAGGETMAADLAATATSARATAWHREPLWDCAGARRLQARILAAVDPIPLGGDFEAELRDTWIRTAAPEKQKVRWTFQSPSGRRWDLLASYEGDYRWTIRFHPEEPGPWRYAWSQEFDHEYRSAPGRFDVLPLDPDSARAEMRAWIEKIRDPGGRRRPARKEVEAQRRTLQRMERALMSGLTAATFRSAEGEEVRSLLREAKEAIGGEVIPDSIPIRPDAPPRWAQAPASDPARAGAGR